MGGEGGINFGFVSVPVIMGTKPALMKFAHQSLIVSDRCHSHSKTIRSERRKVYHKGINNPEKPLLAHAC